MEIDGTHAIRLPRRQFRAATWVGLALALTAAIGCVVMLLDVDVLRGPAAMNGSGRGTALAVLTVGLPLLLVSIVAARRGSALAQLTWIGALGMFAYNALMFLFATPFNPLFLLYVGWLSLTAWSIGLLLCAMDPDDLAGRFSATAPRRGVAAYIWVVAAGNAALWLRGVLPALFQTGQPDFLQGTGTTTNIGYIQDLALWLPFLAVVAGWLWRGRSWGFVLSVGGLVMWVLESVSIAIDQAYGAAADPHSAVVSVTLTPVFAMLAVVGTVPILLLLKGFDREGLTAKLRRLTPPGGGRTAWAWALAALALFVAGTSTWGAVRLIQDGFGMPPDWLAGTPFTAWTVPGIALLVGVTAPHLALAALIALRSPWARLTGLACGVSLVAWIVVQLVVLQHTFFLQPVIAALGVVELWLAHRWRAAAPVPGAIRWLRDVRLGDVGAVGSKAANLGELTAAGLPVPDGFVITAPIGAQARSAVSSKTIPDAMAAEILAAYHRLGDEVAVAVRASDTSPCESSEPVARVNVTFTNVHGDAALLARIVDCWASLDRSQVTVDSVATSAADEPSLAVVVQVMVSADTSGVMFAAESSAPEADRYVVQAALGQGEAVADGLVEPDIYVVSRDARHILSVRTGGQTMKIVSGSGGVNVRRATTQDERDSRVLTGQEILDVARLGIAVEDYYGSPRDIEWVMARGRAFLVQAGPPRAHPRRTTREISAGPHSDTLEGLVDA